MYLVNVHTMQLEFHEEEVVTYAILSHRWRHEEILFEDMQTGQIRSKAGFSKLDLFCKKAAAAGYTYGWVDTCCIDKRSSAELSESINSMFRWYANAGVCFAYLFDVGSAAELGGSRWFTRGWCLQELLAPRALVFFDNEWRRLGSRDELASTIVRATGIPRRALGWPLEDFSVAQRMSWAAGRVTTRVEDVAYSLLGIFGVNMPLLYGEGSRAFVRLQEEIIRRSNDHSIFVHTAPEEEQGLFATSPADFRDSSRVVRTEPHLGEPYSLTNMGLSIKLELYPWKLDTYLALLDCREEGSESRVGILVQLQPQVALDVKSPADDHVVRVKSEGRGWIGRPKIEKLPKIVKRTYLKVSGSEVRKRYGFWVRKFEFSEGLDKISEVTTIARSEWPVGHMLMIPEGVYATGGILWQTVTVNTRSTHLWMRLGFTTNFEPVIEFKQVGAGPTDDPIPPDLLLKDMRWLFYPDRDTSVLIRGNRDKRQHMIWKWHSIETSVCVTYEKVEVDGFEVWAVDIVWQPLRSDAIPDLWRTRCTGCNKTAMRMSSLTRVPLTESHGVVRQYCDPLPGRQMSQCVEAEAMSTDTRNGRGGEVSDVDVGEIYQLVEEGVLESVR